MNTPLTNLQMRLCNILQTGLPIVEQPFEKIAEALGCKEAETIDEVRKLKDSGIIRRIAALLDHRSLGRVSVLAAAAVPQDKLREVTGSINAVEGVSHNYLRDHKFNLWFTLQAGSVEEAARILDALSRRHGMDFHCLPSLRIFKLDVRFDAASGGTRLLPPDERSMLPGRPLVLSELQKSVLSSLSRGVEIVQSPFKAEGLKNAETLAVAQELYGAGAIRRIAAVADYRRLGFEANAMLVCEVDQRDADLKGVAMAALDNVSHCYLRRPFKGWPFNLFAMMHGPDFHSLGQRSAEFCRNHAVTNWQLLATVKEFKKKPVPV